MSEILAYADQLSKFGVAGLAIFIAMILGFVLWKREESGLKALSQAIETITQMLERTHALNEQKEKFLEEYVKTNMDKASTRLDSIDRKTDKLQNDISELRNGLISIGVKTIRVTEEDSSKSESVK